MLVLVHLELGELLLQSGYPLLFSRHAGRLVFTFNKCQNGLSDWIRCDCCARFMHMVGVSVGALYVYILNLVAD